MNHGSRFTTARVFRQTFHGRKPLNFKDYFLRFDDFLNDVTLPSMIDPIKIEHFRNLISLSVADGKIEEVERVALSKIAFAQGIPLDRMNVMLDRANEYLYLIPQNNTEREKQLDEMIEFAHVDGDFSPAEQELIQSVGEKLGFSQTEVSSKLNGYRQLM
jgi:uncharacterized tellurite resistance protein B-like protein